ncbi:uncharacterized protein [Apostichopus japonicus]|uniref:uncharacterized protein n=1 Tax=Stichopus japonicus TaxID=307972 RepID=UPI003AB90585
MEATKSSMVVSQFLENIGLAELKPQLEAHRIDDEVFELLDDESITQIIPKLGLRLKFKHHYNLRCNSLSEAHRIDDEVFELLDDESITQIIPKLGLRLKFKHHYNLRCNSLSEGRCKLSAILDSI